jgi:hypothetical protein
VFVVAEDQEEVSFEMRHAEMSREFGRQRTRHGMGRKEIDAVVDISKMVRHFQISKRGISTAAYAHVGGRLNG